ncbi:hypothetical protein GYMLUDRAFT_260953 [Collybiopsis luxurians FD-317 M1]|uniref:Uncharacterized protein n=1 Tax=Collybiopsis luxurians FD-317 M1 TaxID=944289 RepID=A0A0D0CG01_9AGAR|nr:hypothetical protein GYMLUDRAFT_260953 [Collybiopsis luxurians FD-317 M1]
MADFCLRIDDADPRINYLGPWQTLTNASNPGDFPNSTFYNGTLHGTDSISSFLSFSYQGLPTAAIFGNATNGPFINCSIEDSKGKIVEGYQGDVSIPTVNAPLCSFTTFAGEDIAIPDNYVLKFYTANSTADSNDFQILIDYIVYQPFANVSLENHDVIQVGSCLPLTQFQGLQVGPGWESGGHSSGQVVESLQSSLSGSPMTIKFNGTSVGVEAMNNGSFGLGHYSIDGNDPVSLILPKSTDNQLLLLESSLSPAEHTLTIQIDDEISLGALFVNDIFFTSFESKGQNISSPSTTQASTATATPSEQGGSKNHGKAVIAGVTTGVAVLLLVLAITFFILRKRRKSRVLPSSSEFFPNSYAPRISRPSNSSKMAHLGSELGPLAASSSSLAAGADLAQTRLATLKLQQRLEVTQGQLRREQEVARNHGGLSNTPPGMMMPIHVDSGLRLGPQGEVRDTALEGVPPEYTEV